MTDCFSCWLMMSFTCYRYHFFLWIQITGSIIMVLLPSSIHSIKVHLSIHPTQPTNISNSTIHLESNWRENTLVTKQENKRVVYIIISLSYNYNIAFEMLPELHLSIYISLHFTLTFPLQAIN